MAQPASSSKIALLQNSQRLEQEQPLASCVRGRDNLANSTAMPRYFFHVREGSELNRDTEGQDFADVEAARREAINSIREIVGEKLLHGGALNHRCIEIADETGHVVDVVNSREVLLKDGRIRTYSDDIVQSSAEKPPQE